VCLNDTLYLMKKILWIFIISLSLYNTISSAESLTENQKGKIKFDSIPTITLNQFLNGESGSKTTEISGTLIFPSKKWKEPLPAIVLLHGSGGPRAGERHWSKILNKIGIATFIVDSNSARGCPPSTKGVCKNYSQHQGMANIVDAYRALELLSTHPKINPNQIAVMGFSVGGKAALYSSLTRFQKMWGPPGLEFAAYMAFYPACNIIFDNDEKISDRPIRIFYGELDEWSSPTLCQKYVNRLNKLGKDVSITIYPGSHHNFDHRGDAGAPSSLPTNNSRIKCQFNEERKYGSLIALEKDKNNSELENLYQQCISIFAEQEKMCRLNAYISLESSNFYSSVTSEYFSKTLNEIEKLNIIKNESEPNAENSTVDEEVSNVTLDSDTEFAYAVEKFIKKEWGEGDWEIGFINCMVGYESSFSEEIKKAVIKYGPEKAFNKIKNRKDLSTYDKVFNACERNSEDALEAANKAREEAAEEKQIDTSYLPTLVASLETQLVEQEKNYSTTSFLLSDTSCISDSKRTLKYNNKSAKKVKEAVTNFIIKTFKIH